MTAPTTAATAWHWPADVLAFAAEQDVPTCLEPLLEATRRLFPGARDLRVFLEIDPEIPGDRHIVFEVRVPAEAIANYVEMKRQWHAALFDCCPGPVTCTFRFSLILLPP